jgi:hypothetical protein
MKTTTAFGAVAIGLYLSGCGGGGGGGAPVTSIVAPNTTPAPAPTPPAPPVATAQSFRTAEYLRMGVLDQIHAADGYALGYTGQGVKIGIVDFNFDLSSSEVAFDAASVGANAQAAAIYQAETNEALQTDSHGFAVAAAAAARKNNIGGHGVAFDATVVAVDYFSDVNDSSFVRNSTVVHNSDPWGYIVSQGARIINMSFGYEGTNALGSLPLSSGDLYRVAPGSTAVIDGALLVSSAGNAGGANASLSNLDVMSDLAARGLLNSGPGGFIIAGAVDGNNQIASFSDRAGTAMQFYMVAPGTNLVLPWNGGTALLSGTSFAAPLISGAAALIFQRWPNLTARDVANILFSSATDLGAPGVDPIYGHGLLDIATALQPLGVTTFAVANGTAPVVSATDLVLGPAFGDAPALHQALSHVMVLDGFKRDFEIDLSHRAVARPNLPDLFSVMEQRLGWRATDLPLGYSTTLSYDVGRNPEDGIAPFQTLAGPQDHLTHQTIFRLSGAADGLAWSTGNGLSLRDGMGQLSDTVFASLSLTNAFSPMVGAAPGTFAALRLPLADDTGLSFGAAFSQNQGLTEHLRTAFRNSAEMASLRLDHQAGDTRFALELGDVLESGGLMGSLAAGGLDMAERASTVWTTATVETALDAHWSLKGAFTLAAAGASHPVGSLISSIGPIYASSFALGLAGENLFRPGDALSFTLAQPLRAEQGSLTLVSGIGRDWTSGDVLMGQTKASLLPSGRELDLETGYRFSFGGWGAQANLAYAVDPDHVQNKTAVVALFTLARAF